MKITWNYHNEFEFFQQWGENLTPICTNLQLDLVELLKPKKSYLFSISLGKREKNQPRNPCKNPLFHWLQVYLICHCPLSMYYLPEEKIENFLIAIPRKKCHFEAIETFVKWPWEFLWLVIWQIFAETKKIEIWYYFLGHF